MKNKPADFKKEAPENQFEMPGFESTNLIALNLWVARSYGNFRDIFIPAHKSIPEDSSVYEAWENDHSTSEKEIISFGRYNNKAVIESKLLALKVKSISYL